jgi:hypothetical protein
MDEPVRVSWRMLLAAIPVAVVAWLALVLILSAGPR